MLKTSRSYSGETVDLFEPSANESAKEERIDRWAPLATRMRPRTLDEFVGQADLLGPGKPLRQMILGGEAGSFVLWGPPGSGKTTLARIAARQSEAYFEPFSAVGEGVARIREIVAAAERRRRDRAERTLLFIDEVHALNRSQQDCLLPHLESNLVQMVAATTENVSFELNRALLSRLRVFVLKPLRTAELRLLLDRALADTGRGLGSWALNADDDALDLMAELADGDGRRALALLEVAAALVSQGGRIRRQIVLDAAGQRIATYDKGRDHRYDLLSALQKSVRNSDAEAAIYYLARMIEGGEDHRVIGRRLAVMAAEDVGLADPQALPVTMAALQAMELVGPPEGWIPMAEAVLYLATAPKSDRGYRALKAALAEVRRRPGVEVPAHLRNAPTALLQSLGHGRGYDHPFDRPEHVSPMRCLPVELGQTSFYEPSRFGVEAELVRRLEWWAEKRRAQEGG